MPRQHETHNEHYGHAGAGSPEHALGTASAHAAQASMPPHAHDKHVGHSPQMFRDLFWLSAVLTIPAVVWSEHIETLLHYRAPAIPGARWIPAVFGTLVFLYGGAGVRRRAGRRAHRRRPPGW